MVLFFDQLLEKLACGIDTWRLELLLLLFFALTSSFVGEDLAELLPPSLKMALASDRMSFSNLSPELGRLAADDVALVTRLLPHDNSIPCSPKIGK